MPEGAAPSYRIRWLSAATHCLGPTVALMPAWELRSSREAVASHGPVIFDRGVPDVIGSLRLCAPPVPIATMRAAKMRRYAKRVFIAPHRPAIFAQDAEHKQTRAEAEATYHAMIEAYTSLGYELVSLPLVPIAERKMPKGLDGRWRASGRGKSSGGHSIVRARPQMQSNLHWKIGVRAWAYLHADEAVRGTHEPDSPVARLPHRTRDVPRDLTTDHSRDRNR